MADTTQSPALNVSEVLSRFKSPWSLSALVFATIALLDWDNLPESILNTGQAYLGTLPFILFAVATVAYLKASGAEALVANAFQGRETRMIFLAAVFGGLAPFCSCEVIPFIAGLLALGAPISAVMAFWLASPLIDPPTVAITAAALGWDMAIAKTLSAVGIGIAGGFVLKALMSAGAFSDPLKQTSQSSCGCGPSPFTGKPEWVIWKDSTRLSRFGQEAWSNFVFLSKWLVLAYALETVLIDYVPAELILKVIGGEGLGAIALAAVVGMPAYVNGYVAPALLSGFVQQGMSQGAALSFMIAGSVSCIPAMAAVWSLVKPRVFAAYVALGLSGAIFCGMVFKMLA